MSEIVSAYKVLREKKRVNRYRTENRRRTQGKHVGMGMLRHWHPAPIATDPSMKRREQQPAKPSQESAAPSPPSPLDQSEPRALSQCSRERSRRGSHKGNKSSRITSECINYFQWLPCANPLPRFPQPGVLGTAC